MKVEIKRIIFDVDGVLANFILGFTALGHQWYNTPVVDTEQYLKWGKFPGLGPDKEAALWAAVKAKETHFWFNLYPLVPRATFAMIDSMSFQGHEIYYVTSRPGERSKMQTEEWLKRQGIYNPTVIVSSKKGEAAAMLGADYCLDDKAENAWCVAWLSPKTKSFLLNRKYNQYDPDAFGSHHVQCVDTVEEFLDIVNDPNAT